jgi:hypothetical protein
MAMPVSDLGEFLTANGLSAFAQTFFAEQVTLGDIVHLNENDLKGLGIPLGPRKRILHLFSVKPHQPDGPAGSHGSPRHMALLQAGGVAAADTLTTSGKKYGCFLSHHKAACAMEGETEPGDRTSL